MYAQRTFLILAFLIHTFLMHTFLLHTFPAAFIFNDCSRSSDLQSLPEEFREKYIMSKLLGRSVDLASVHMCLHALILPIISLRYTYSLHVHAHMCRGACGEVKLAFQKGTNDKFAVKIISKRTFSVGVSHSICDGLLLEHFCIHIVGKGMAIAGEYDMYVLMTPPPNSIMYQ